MYRCSLIPYAVFSALRTEHVYSLRIGISLKMEKYPVKSTSESTYGRMERTLRTYKGNKGTSIHHFTGSQTIARWTRGFSKNYKHE